MNTKKGFSWKYIVCLSLIISEIFYFSLRTQATLINDRDYSYIALNRFIISDIIVSVAVVFVFSDDGHVKQKRGHKGYRAALRN